MLNKTRIILNASSTADGYDLPGNHGRQFRAMIDAFALALTHGLMMLAAWRLLSRPDLDDDKADPMGDPDKSLLKARNRA